MASMLQLDDFIKLSCRNKFVNMIFKEKLLMQVEAKKIYLHKCIHCDKLIPLKHHKELKCPKNEDGKMRHQADRSFNFKDFLIYFRYTYQVSWRHLFWKVWSYMHLLKCEACSSVY